MVTPESKELKKDRGVVVKIVLDGNKTVDSPLSDYQRMSKSAFVVEQPIVAVACLSVDRLCIQTLQKNLIHDIINGRVETVYLQEFLVLEFVERTVGFQSFHGFSPYSIPRIRFSAAFKSI